MRSLKGRDCAPRRGRQARAAHGQCDQGSGREDRGRFTRLRFDGFQCFGDKPVRIVFEPEVILLRSRQGPVEKVDTHAPGEAAPDDADIGPQIQI